MVSKDKLDPRPAKQDRRGEPAAGHKTATLRKGFSAYRELIAMVADGVASSCDRVSRRDCFVASAPNKKPQQCSMIGTSSCIGKGLELCREAEFSELGHQTFVSVAPTPPCERR